MQQDTLSSRNAEMEKLKVMLNGMSDSKISVKDKGGETALRTATKRDLTRAGIALLNAGAQAVVADNNNNNDHPLHHVCHSRNLRLAKELLANNADIEAKGRYGETPLGMACR